MQKHFNQLSAHERADLLTSPYGRELLNTLSRSTAVFEWGNLFKEEVPHHGTVFFIRPNDTPIAITARHVYEGYIRQFGMDPSVTCQINELRFNPTERLIALGHDCDVATFWMTQAEFERLDRITTPWPPLIQQVGEIVLFAGLPAVEKKALGDRHVAFGVYTAMARVDSVSERDLSSVRPRADQTLDVLKKGVPPHGYDMAGMSGGPMVTLVENSASRIVSWQLAGVIYECHQGFEIVNAARADSIQSDGTLLF